MKGSSIPSLSENLLQKQLDKEPKLLHLNSRNAVRTISAIDKRHTDAEHTLNVSLFKSIIEETHKKISGDSEFLEKNASEIEKINSKTDVVDPELKIIRVLINFDAYTLQNRLTEPKFHSPEEIATRFKAMKNILEVMISCLSLQDFDKYINFSNEKECFEAFQEVFTNELFIQPYFRRVCSEVYRAVVDKKTTKPFEILSKRFYESIKVFLYGISLPSDNVADYPLHKAIYKSDIEQIKKLCEGSQTDSFYCHVEQADPIGLSALMLAIQLGKPEIVKILVENGADPRHKVIPKSKFPMEEAMNLKNKEIIRTLIIAGSQLRLNRWEKTKEGVLKLLESIPDFSFEIHWECDSNFIPFVSKLAPSDTNKISKRGSSLRMDTTIAGIDKLKVTRGNLSLFLLGREHPGYEGKILMVNHGKKTITNLMNEIDLKRLEKSVDYIAKQNNLPNEIKPEDIQFEPAKSWRGEPVIEKIQNYRTVKYHAKGTLSLLYTKKVNEESWKFDSYEKYFETCFQTRFWAPTSLDDISPFEQVLLYIRADPQLSKKLLEDEAKEENKNQPLVTKIQKMKNSQNKQSKETKKQIDASIWMTDSFPLHFEHLLAILDILSSASPNIGKLKDFLEKKSILQNHSFPLKAIIPLFLSVSAVINFKNFVFKTPDSSLFEPAKDKSLTPVSQIMKISPSSDRKMKIEDPSTLVQNLAKIQPSLNNLDLQKIPSLHTETLRSDVPQGTTKVSTQTMEDNIAGEHDTSVMLGTSKALTARMERYSVHSKKRLDSENLLLLKNESPSGAFKSDFLSNGRFSYPNALRDQNIETKTYQNKSNLHKDQQTNSSNKTSDRITLGKHEQEEEKLNLHQNGVFQSSTYELDYELIPAEYLLDTKGNGPSKFAIPATVIRNEKRTTHPMRASLKW